MAVRLRDWEIPYVWGTAIEITNNHVINLLLREANNLIHLNENNEIYVDLQLDDWIQPDDDFPVWVTTGKILEEDWWQQSWLILNWKTTSGDYARLIYANDWSLYVDLWDWVWIEILWAWWVKVKWGDIGGYLRNQTDLAQALDEKVNLGDNNIYDGTIVRLNECIETPWWLVGSGKWIELNPNGTVLVHEATTTWYKEAILNNWSLELLSNTALGWDKTATIDHEKIVADDWVNNKIYYFLGEHRIATLDDIQPWTRITIDKNPSTWVLTINADVSGVMTYKWNVTDQSQLPTTGQQVWDCWYSEADHTMFAWDWTQWNDIGGTGIDLTNYFNLNVNTSDDITEWSIHLFCTSIEKNYWNNKQETLIAWDNITINNNVISARSNTYTGWSNISIDQNNAINNDAPFEPENAGTMWQFLQKSNTGYKWINAPFVTSVNWQTWPVSVSEFLPENAWVTWDFLQKTNDWYKWITAVLNYRAGTGININNGLISNTLPFDPENAGTTGQVLKKTASGYQWANESWWWGGWGWGGTYTAWDWISIINRVITNTKPFEPSQQWNPWDILVMTQNWYEWGDLPSGENNVKFWTINTENQTAQEHLTYKEIVDWVNADDNNWAILNDVGKNDVFIFHHVEYDGNTPEPVFFGKKRNSEKVWVNWIVDWPRGQFTKAWEWKLTLYQMLNPQNWYMAVVVENPDSATKTNYISAFWAQYEWPFIPLDPSEPATKEYVDRVAAGSVQVPAITNNTTGTTSSVAQVWAWSKTELNNLSTRSANCLYFSFDS